MINLKKNDKIIIIVAVIIIIISGIGIAAYNPPDLDEDEKIPIGEYTYNIDWDLRTSSLLYTDFANKGTPFEATVLINQGNLKEIVFNLSWVDDKATILNRFGLDTLTLEVTTPDGTVYEESGKSASKSKEGNVVIPISVNGMPQMDSIDANNTSEAEEILNEEPYFDDEWMNEPFEVKVSVKVGEIRILKKMRDSGNNFDLEITYDYYDAMLTEEEMKETGENIKLNELMEEEYTPPYLSMIIGTGCGRYI